ncbi:MAG TPA: bestrophin family ion channel [Lacipirellulaceae bacterium]|jgi:putative membrane protein|nr:bestrophin family ion channel [Lacipirellulaceae bacterium]
MTPWDAHESFDVLVVGKRLTMFLLAVTVYCVAAGAVIRYFDVPAVNWGSATALINTVILSLLMSFRNNAAYQRWWEARGLWGKLVNDSRNLAAKCAAFVPADVLGRSSVKAALIGFADALRRQLRDETPRLKEINGFETDGGDPAHVPLFLAGRLFDDVAEWKRTGAIDQATLWVLDLQLSGLLDVCGGCEKIRSTPLSPSYKGLLRAGLVLNVLAEPWLTVPETGFWALPVFVLVCFFLFGVELIDTIVEEPFGRDRDDLDLDRYCQTIRDSVGMFLDAGRKAGS